MKTSTYIIIILLFVAVIGGGFFIYKKMEKEKKQEIRPDATPQPQPSPSRTQAKPSIMRLQRYLNTQLPDDYTPLVVDGIWGPKTKAALDYVKNNGGPQSEEEMETLLGFETLAKIANAELDLATAPVTLVKEGADWVKKHLFGSDD